ncbi:hypothetical protein KBA41_03010 [Candidatus Ozemobacteraceae bacterium]|nr:hypothetical protein [Candidatus Ozemobacteraceae bacterium]
MRFHLAVLAAIAMFACFSAPARAEGPAWAVDEKLGFHFAFFDAEGHTADDVWKAIPTVKVSPIPATGAADITNIDLDGLRGLGFPVPARPGPGSFTFFLKFFGFPAWLDSTAAANRVADAYGLHFLPDGESLRAWLANRDHLLVKKGFIAPTGKVFDADTPYPALVVPQKDVSADGVSLTPQNYFDTYTPFVSLYLNPSDAEPAGLAENVRAAWSGKGVLAFHKALLDAYTKNYTSVKGVEPDKFSYFRVPGASGTVTILKLPVKPMTFEANWRDLPMPENPEKVFLSALLLIYRYEYTVTTTLDDATIVDSPGFAAATKLLRAQVFEAGSVVRLP